MKDGRKGMRWGADKKIRQRMLEMQAIGSALRNHIKITRREAITKQENHMYGRVENLGGRMTI